MLQDVLIHSLLTGEITVFRTIALHIKIQENKEFCYKFLKIMVLREKQLKGFWSPIMANFLFLSGILFSFPILD